MNAVPRALLALSGAVALGAVQYFIHQPWRYLITWGEIATLLVVVTLLWGRTKELVRASEEHRARLDAIAGFASKAQVVHDANRIVDAITSTLYVHEGQEAVGLE